MPTPAIELPAVFPAGVTLEYRRIAEAYPAADGWRLKLALAGPSVLEQPFEAEFQIDTGDWLFTLDSETTAALAPGLYRWAERASLGLEDLVLLGEAGWVLEAPLDLGHTDLASIGAVRSSLTNLELVEAVDFTVDLAAGTLTPITGGALTDFATDGAIRVADVQWLAAVRAHPLRAGLTTVTLDLFTATAGQALSFHERMLPILYAAFEGRIPKGLEGFQIYNRTVSLMPIEKVAQMIAQFEQIIAMRKRAARGRLGRQIRVWYTGTANERR